MAGIKVAVSGQVLAKGAKVSKAGNAYAEVRVGWLDAGDDEGKGASAGMYTVRCAPEVAAGCEIGSQVVFVANGREKDWKIDVGFFEISGRAATAVPSRSRAA